jgi:hypothetical protein
MNEQKNVLNSDFINLLYKSMEAQIATLYSHPKHQEAAKIFTEKYDLVEAIILGDNRYSKSALRPIKNRVCRFCNRPYPATKFSNYSHLFSDTLGYGNLFSDFECDDCNHSFGKNENDLVNFLGISRSIAALNKTGLGPTFKGKMISARSKIYASENIVVISVKEFAYDESSAKERKEGIVRLPYTKQPYIPLKVYKALVKAAVSMLNTDEVSAHYRNALKFLKDEILMTGCFIRDDIEVITIQRDKSFEQKLSKYDPKTDTTIDTDEQPDSIRNLVITKDGFTVNPKEFSEFMKREFGD